ncbi:MAG: hypothetical protein IJ642_04420 [Oscillospiraceae bacterium]|nr:hypothetical protein [Oscillospiraceae bacterium]
MSRKLKKALKEIYASEQPSNFPEFLKEIQKERNKRKFRFMMPVSAMLFLCVIAGYGYFSTQNFYRPEISVQTAEQQILVSEPETVLYTTEFPVTTMQTTFTTIRTETTIPETSVTQIHLPIQTVTESISETTTFTPETETIPPEQNFTPETEAVQPEPEPEEMIIPESNPIQTETQPETEIQTTIDTTGTTPLPETTTIPTETNPEYNYIMIPIEEIDRKQLKMFAYRQLEVYDLSMNSMIYADAKINADTMLSKWKNSLLYAQNSYWSEYMYRLDVLKGTVGETAFEWGFRNSVYQNIVLNESQLIEQYFIDNNQQENLEKFYASQENYEQLRERFRTECLQEDFDYPPYNGVFEDENLSAYFEAKLTEIRSVALMEYFNYIPYVK